MRCNLKGIFKELTGRVSLVPSGRVIISSTVISLFGSKPRAVKYSIAALPINPILFRGRSRQNETGGNISAGPF